LKDLEKWIQKKHRKPLIIRGARQIGKSTLVREFARINNWTLVEINLEKFLGWTDIFKQNKPELIMSAIEDLQQKKIPWLDPKAKILLFIDEIQAIPAAISCLRYFYEDFPKLPVLCAGSLLEFALSETEYSMPVGRIEYLHMVPMTFFEYLLARGESYILEKLQTIESTQQISLALHEKCLVLFKEFLFVGGMPEAVKMACEESLEQVSQVHELILETYQNDFVKYSKKSHLLKIQKVFRYLYLHPCKKIKFSNISKEDTSRDLKANLELLIKAKVITPVFHTSCSGLPLEASKDESIFKNLVLDVGLMNHMQKLSYQTLKHSSEIQLLSEGEMAEQFVGQHLLGLGPSYQNPSLYYWLREGKRANAEVDFIWEHSPHLMAVEVKAGAGGKIRSLHQWVKDISYKKKICVRFNLSQGAEENIEYQFEDQRLKYKLFTIPIYLIQNFEKFI